ncbi:PAS domain-containing sensor histidine kinase [Aequorivita flava]|uniref:histidine kinase n=1 Tax=Aequorivita flava TaxID=3114371 RepID=A0AB35YPR1_9FLAO
MKHYPHILEDLEISIWEYNIQTKEIACNENWASLLGYTRKELEPITEETWTNLFHPKYSGKSGKLFKAHLKGETKQYKCKIRLKHKDGHSVWILTQGKVVEWDANGAPLLMVGFNKDISKEIHDQLSLKKYKDISEIASNVAQTGYWELDYITNSFYWSPMTKEIYGEASDFTPKADDVLKYFSEGEHRETIAQSIKDAVLSRKNFDQEVQIYTKNNSLKWIRIIGIAEFKNAKCIRLYGIVQDIDTLKKIQLKTAIQEEQFRQTFEHATIGMALVGLDGTWLKVNEGICEFLGYTKKELYKLTFKDITHPADLDKDMKYLVELLNNKRKNYEMEKRYICKNGEIVWAHLSVSLVRDDRGKALHFVSQILDINENKLLNDAMQEQNNRLINFAYIVSHNLRSHTGNIAMLLELLASEDPKLAENEFLVHLKSASDNLNETVKHLNEVVVINTKIYDNLEPLNLHQFIEKALLNIQGLIASTDSVIVNNCSPDIYIAGIPAYLDSILLNFLTNAIKYRSPDRIPNIEISTENTIRFVVLKIKDNGSGINLKRDGAKLFGMYKTFHDNEDSRGIGLFITKNQVEVLGGKIEVTSEVGKGTEFSIYFLKSKKKSKSLTPIK